MINKFACVLSWVWTITILKSYIDLLLFSDDLYWLYFYCFTKNMYGFWLSCSVPWNMFVSYYKVWIMWYRITFGCIIIWLEYGNKPRERNFSMNRNFIIILYICIYCLTIAIYEHGMLCHTITHKKEDTFLFFASYLLTGLCIRNWTMPLLVCLYIKRIHQLQPYTFLNLWYIKQRKHYVCFVSHKNLSLTECIM